jgi:YfiH family protein
VAEAMIRRSLDGIVFYQFAALAQDAEVQHAIFTRSGGKSSGAFHSLNVGELVGDEAAAVRANHETIFRALGIRPQQVVSALQVHGAHVAVVGAADQGAVLTATDSLICQERGTYLLLRFADCLPLMLYDPQRRAVALAHVGWRGLVAGVVLNTMAELRRLFGCKPCDIVAGLGPAIGPCCYDVGADVVAKVEHLFGSRNKLLSAQKNGKVHFDLPAAVRWQLRNEGVQQIEDSGLCTSCHTEEFYSHRAERGHTGRFAAILALRGESPVLCDPRLTSTAAQTVFSR